jgi:serine phosphatase RsbU (regulator of sigma subunit)/anti-anti-sigma regulatory factor
MVRPVVELVEADVEGRPPSILIVDDELLNRKLVASALTAAGTFELYEAADGIEAQEILRERPIDVVITDLMMPRLDGLGLIRWAAESCPGPTWIIHSAFDTFDAAVQALQLGAFDFVAKPLHSVRLLQSSVGNAVRQRRLIAERERLRHELQRSNERLKLHVAQLEEVCRLLREQADTIDEDLRRAELIQRALLPRAPAHLEGFAVDAVYRPSHSVGGDLYDVVRLDDRHVVLYVADAAGHGVSAAMLSVVLKHRLRMVDGAGRPIAPAQVLASLNAELCEECTAPGLFVTAAYCLLDTATHELAVAAAGHPPLALRRRSGEVVLIERTGPALGLSRTAGFEDRRIVLDPGDRLLLYTDGLCDTSTDGASFDTAHIAGAFAEAKGGGSELLQSILDQAAGARGGAPNEDDVTVVLLSAGELRSSVDYAPAAEERPPPSIRPPHSGGPVVAVGTSAADALWVAVEGRGTWIHCAALHEACASALGAGRSLVIDLSRCTYLDSTFLGTIHELVEREHPGGPSVRIQGAPPDVRHLFDELAMADVLAHVAADAVPPPAHLEPLAGQRGPQATAKQRILSAHEALLGLSEKNREQFQGVVDALRAELR